MRLGDVLNKIFRKRKSDVLVKRNEKPAEDIYKSTEHTIEDGSRFKKVSEHIIAEQKNPETFSATKGDKRSVFLMVGISSVVLLVVIALVGIIYVRISNSSFSDGEVLITIKGPEVISVGDRVVYEITVNNKNRVGLKDLSIGLNIPDNFALQESGFIVDKNLSGARIEVGDLNGRSKKTYKAEFLIEYSQDNNFLFKVVANYKPNNVSSFFQVNATKTIQLRAAMIQASIIVADRVSSGELVELNIVVQNNSEEKVDDLILSVNYPKGFNFEDSTLPSTDEDHKIFNVDNLNFGEKMEFKIFGRLTGAVDVVKRFNLELTKKGSILSKGEGVSRIIPSKIIIKQESDKKAVYPGDFVSYTISFKNNSNVDLHNLVLKVHLPGKYIKKENVKLTGGYYNGEDNTITWRASDLKELQTLKQGSEGVANFSIQTQNDISLGDTKENINPYMRIYSEVESLDVDSPIFTNKKVVSSKLKVLINSVMKITGEIAYLAKDNNNIDEGYLYPGKKIFLRVILDMKNTTNNLNDVKLLFHLPSGVSWEKQIYPDGDNVKFNDQSNEVIWKIGKVAAGTGFIVPSEKAEFIIGVTPPVNQIGQAVDLIRDMRIRARDVFTNNEIEYTFNVTRSNIVKGLQDTAVREE